MGLRISFWCIKVTACLVKVEGEQQQAQGSGVPTRRELFSKWVSEIIIFHMSCLRLVEESYEGCLFEV